MTIRGIIFSLSAHRAVKEHGDKSRKGIDRMSIVQLAQNQCKISAENTQKALEWLDSEGYIKLHPQCIVLTKAGWELSDRYIKALKKWYKSRKNTNKAQG